jgi:uncharacterized protein (DUF849 family)
VTSLAATYGARRWKQGGHLHVGLEFFAGSSTPTNVELVAEAVEAAAGTGGDVATSAAAAAQLGLPRVSGAGFRPNS